MDVLSIANRFALPSEAIEALPFGNGHIHSTFRIRCEDGSLALLQQINTSVFQNVDGLMQNIEKVTAFLRSRIEEAGGDASRECLRIIKTKDGSLFTKAEEGTFRLYAFIADSLAFDRAENDRQFGKVGFAFGRFLKQLHDFDASCLCETIPHFHNTPKRFEALEQAL